MSLHILIIEDDEELREISARMLKIAGYEVYTTESRDKTIKLINEFEEINTLLLDISMPGMTIDVFLLRLNEKINQLRIIFSSGNTSDEVKSFLDKSRSFHFLSKPYGLDDLKEVLHVRSQKNNSQNNHR